MQPLHTFAAILLLSASVAAQAHAIWIERDADGPARAYFGEVGQGVREKTGGHLDRIASPRAWQGEGKQALALARKPDHIEIGTSAPGDVLLVEAGLAPREDKQKGGYTKAIFYAKAGRAGVRPQLEFDLVPATPAGSSFVLTLRGKSLARTRVTVIGPPGWEKPLRTDEWGQLVLPVLPWKGRYVIEASHTEDTPGEAAGQKYQRLTHVLTLSLVLEEGASAPGRP